MQRDTIFWAQWEERFREPDSLLLQVMATLLSLRWVEEVRWIVVCACVRVLSFPFIHASFLTSLLFIFLHSCSSISSRSNTLHFWPFCFSYLFNHVEMDCSLCLCSSIKLSIHTRFISNISAFHYFYIHVHLLIYTAMHLYFISCYVVLVVFFTSVYLVS